jgi:hypothetical protein
MPNGAVTSPNGEVTPQSDSFLGMLLELLKGRWTEREEQTGQPMGIQNVAALSTLEFLKPPQKMVPTKNPKLLKMGLKEEMNPEYLQMVAMGPLSSASKVDKLAKGALKAAKKSGEKMITLYRGNRKWASKEMVQNKSFVGPETVGGHTISVAHKTAPSKSLFVSTDPVYAAGRAEGGFFSINAKRILKFMKKEKAYYNKHDMMIYPNNPHWNKKDFNKAIKEQMDNIASIKRQAKYENRAGQHVLEFQVPQSWVEKYGKTSDAIGGAYEGTFLFDEGLPVAFLKKVHRN